MSIKNLKDLISEAHKQPEPQRLLLLFAQATPMSTGMNVKHQSGTITPVMCVDKLPSEIESFAELVKEADSITAKWDFILISTLSGKNGVVPTSDEAGPYLKEMSNGLASGDNLSKYAILDRDETPIIVS